ncbi:hypothetical protein KY290_004770 [Solanum tuberosum]|uniref:Uncharacterized protein n=1 Tax=Solanum tuberosum TaxID=4113 RepID=A0ABQ7WC61_SOLTU|nr:hypothetical protein KY290_004770 [Solanum tuberosum]
MKRIGYLLEHGVFKKWLTGKGPEDELRKLGLLDCLGIYDHSLAIKVGVHFFLWVRMKHSHQCTIIHVTLLDRMTYNSSRTIPEKLAIKTREQKAI